MQSHAPFSEKSNCGRLFTMSLRISLPNFTCVALPVPADDLKLYSVIQTPDDVNILQDSLGALVAWSDEWQLTISKSKSAILSIGQPNIITQAYRIKDTDVGNVQKIRDLGIIIDDKLKFSQHVSNIVSKARIRANLIFKINVSTLEIETPCSERS